MRATEHSGRNGRIGLKPARSDLVANYKYLNGLVTFVWKELVMSSNDLEFKYYITGRFVPN